MIARYGKAPYARTRMKWSRGPKREKRHIEAIPLEDGRLEALRIGDRK